MTIPAEEDTPGKKAAAAAAACALKYILRAAAPRWSLAELEKHEFDSRGGYGFPFGVIAEIPAVGLR
jgi:NADH:ubiquinone oxidoreductase subunit F (NADH-binding)